jgi:hypothetical protein
MTDGTDFPDIEVMLPESYKAQVDAICDEIATARRLWMQRRRYELALVIIAAHDAGFDRDTNIGAGSRAHREDCANCYDMQRIARDALASDTTPLSHFEHHAFEVMLRDSTHRTHD